MLFECHITLNLSDKEIGVIAGEEFHWKTSEIERDPVLGNNAYFYLTTHDNDYVRMFNRMINVRDFCVRHNAPPVREKIELIMYDTKVKV